MTVLCVHYIFCCLMPQQAEQSWKPHLWEFTICHLPKACFLSRHLLQIVFMRVYVSFLLKK